MPVKNILAVAFASYLLLPTLCLAQELPSWARWSAQPAPHKTVLETFEAVKKAGGTYLPSRDHSFVSIGNWTTGPLRGYWQFSGGDPETAPKRYFRYFISPNGHSSTEVSWACDDTPKSCQEFHASIPSKMPPPPAPAPPVPTPFDSLQETILLEPCSQQAPSQPITYPAHLMGTGIEGTVVLVLTLNPCGEVRRAQVTKSSGNPTLDQAAIQEVQTWTISPEMARLKQGYGGLVRVPVAYAQK